MGNPNDRLSMGEGNTPLIRLHNLERELDWCGQLWAKAEYQNPTGSFKDRGSIGEIKEAIQMGKAGVVCASTGNMAASLAAYAARARIKCFVVVPENTPEGKLRQALACGAQLIKISGSYDDCVAKAVELSARKNYFLCGDYELRRRGQRSIGIELANSGVDIDAFVVPVGNGTVGCAIAEGFTMAERRPRFIGVQGEGSDPIVSAWIRKSDEITPLQSPKTIASAMKVGSPLDGELTLKLIDMTDGLIVSVTDGEIVVARKLLALQEGLDVEFSSAATIAGFIKIKNTLQNNLSVVLILTGNGLKEVS